MNIYVPRHDNALGEIVEKAFTNLVQRCTKLRDVQVNDIFEQDHDDLYFDRIMDLPLLRTYRPTCLITYPRLRRLGEHPHLRDISLGVSSDIDKHCVMSIPQKTLFPSARTLVITHKDLAVCGHLLDTVESTSLDSLDISEVHSDKETVPGTHRLLEKLDRFPHLTRLTVRASRGKTTMNDTPPNDASHTVVINTLRPLFRHNHLTQLSLSFSLAYMDLSDDDIHAVCKAWPKLKTLSLWASKSKTQRPRVTLYGLVYIAENFLELEDLALAIDVAPRTYSELESLVDLAYAKRARPPNDLPRLHSLTVHYGHDIGPMRTITQVALFLVTIFPTLRNFQRIPHELPDDYENDTRRTLTDQWLELEDQVMEVVDERYPCDDDCQSCAEGEGYSDEDSEGYSDEYHEEGTDHDEDTDEDYEDY